MSIKWFFLLFMAFSQGAFAQGLSQRECSEIRAIYQITPPQCSGAPSIAVAQVGTSPTPRDLENNVFFRGGGSQLDTTAISQLQRLANVLNTPEMINACLLLVGHSDSSGAADINMEISYNRAIAVRNMLGPLLSDATRIQNVQSEGETRPLVNLPTESQWQRRVAIWARNCS